MCVQPFVPDDDPSPTITALPLSSYRHKGETFQPVQNRSEKPTKFWENVTIISEKSRVWLKHVYLIDLENIGHWQETSKRLNHYLPKITTWLGFHKPFQPQIFSRTVKLWDWLKFSSSPNNFESRQKQSEFWRNRPLGCIGLCLVEEISNEGNACDSESKSKALKVAAQQISSLRAVFASTSASSAAFRSQAESLCCAMACDEKNSSSLNKDTDKKTRFVHNFRTCKKNAAALCGLRTNFAAKHQHAFHSEVDTAQPHSCKSRNCAQT